MLPDPPDPATLRGLGFQDGETRVVGPGEVWWRAHFTEGAHVLPWNGFRTFGPVLRFDPHRLPQGEDLTKGVWYGASTPDAALGELFQTDRVIDRHRNRPYLTALSFTRPLTVLDVATDSDGAWITRVGGTYAVSTAPHAITQRWARATAAAFPEVDGIRYNSRYAGRVCLALFLPAKTAMPPRPELSLPLDHPALTNRLAPAAQRLGYLLI
ncbi:RES family NAD+ phosphorylase [Mycobacterium sp. NBC_00419]|uniref:RES family NAD+ phosphorylase n=1 Tax=Mycobacterium sp. NBC_00419 TaxID=2975989 RepID=UPI002E1B665A